MQSKAERNEQPVEEKELAETKVVKGQDQSNLSDEELEKVSGGESERIVFTGGWENSPIAESAVASRQAKNKIQCFFCICKTPSFLGRVTVV